MSTKVVKAKYPRRLEEATVGDMIAVMESNSDIELVSRLIGVAKEQIANETNLAAYEEIKRNLRGWLSKANQEQWERYDLPATIKIADSYYDYPKHIGRCTVLQYEMMGKVFSDAESTALDQYVTVCAIYLQPIIHGGKFDEHRVEETAKTLEAARFIDVVGVGNFFFRRMLTMQTGIKRPYLMLLLKLQRRKQALRGLLKLLARIIRFRRS